MDRACGTYGTQQKCLHGFEENITVGVDRILSKCIFQKQDGRNWTYLSRDRDKRRAVVNMVINVRIP